MWAKLSGHHPWRAWFLAVGLPLGRSRILEWIYVHQEMIKEGLRTLKADLADIDNIEKKNLPFVIM